MPNDRRFRLCFQRHVKRSDESNGSKHPKVIFAQSGIGIPDRAKQSRVQVLSATHEIMNLAGDRISKEAVDREVTPACVGLRIGEGNVIRPPPIAVPGLLTESRHLDAGAQVPNEHDTEGRAHRHGPREQSLHLIGRSICGNVVVLWLKAEQFVPYAAAGKPGDVPGVMQT